jgi:type IV secretion system protein VirB9
MVYDYDRDFVYELYCQPFRVSDITLQAGEKANEPPFVSDSERWMLGAGVSYEQGVPVQHFYVKPTEPNLTASLIINTDARVYHLILRSYRDVYMPIVRWRYHSRDMPQNYISVREQAGSTSLPESFENESVLFPDPRTLSFNYKITYGVFKRPSWLPSLVYDDGRKTYITFPELVLTREIPSVFEDRADILNYRVYQNVMIIDKLIEKITIKLGDRIATVEKKRG